MFTCKTAGPVRVGTALTGVVQPMINSVQIYGEKVGYFTLVSFLQNSPTFKRFFGKQEAPGSFRSWLLKKIFY